MVCVVEPKEVKPATEAASRHRRGDRRGCRWRCRDRQRSDVGHVDEPRHHHDHPAVFCRPGWQLEELPKHGHRGHDFRVPLNVTRARPGLGRVVLMTVERSDR